MTEKAKQLNREDIYSIEPLSEAWFALMCFERGLTELGFTLTHEPEEFYYENPKNNNVEGHLPDFYLKKPGASVTIAVEVTISPDLNGKRRQRRVMRAHTNPNFVEVQIPLPGLEDIENYWTVFELLAHGLVELPLERDQYVGPLLVVGKRSLHD